MDSFSTAVKECRKKESSRVLENASIEHAKELFLNLIEEGQVKKENISIVSGNLNTEFYSQLIDVTQKAMKEGVKVSLLVTNPDVKVENHPFANAIIEGGGNVCRAKKQIDAPHFIVVGDKRFRFETDHNQTKAIACFNNKEVGKVLNKLFEKITSTDLIDRITKVVPLNQLSAMA